MRLLNTQEDAGRLEKHFVKLVKALCQSLREALEIWWSVVELSDEMGVEIVQVEARVVEQLL